MDEVRAHFLAHYREGLAVHTRPYAGVPELLDRLKAQGLRLGVATNKPFELASRLLVALGLEGLVSGLAGGGQAPSKPAPALLELALDRLGLAAEPPTGVVYVGDMPVDQEAAHRLGCGFWAAGWGFAPEAFEPQIRLKHPLELLSRLGF